VKCSGLCSGHYNQKVRGRELTPITPRGLVCWCGEPAKAKGLCSKHYDGLRVSRNGTRDQRKARSLRFHYGMALDEFNDRLEQQDHRCKICSEKESGKDLAVDHDHETGEVRALLCARCNTALGLLRDNPVLADKAAAYLRGWKKK
jgi:recombination endonuclease VII